MPYDYKTKSKWVHKNATIQILGWIRWEVFLGTQGLTTVDSEGNTRSFKINDAFTSRYARLFLDDHPEYETIFEIRRIRSV
jgi:hypothetical protein